MTMVEFAYKGQMQKSLEIPYPTYFKDIENQISFHLDYRLCCLCFVDNCVKISGRNNDIDFNMW